jgi:type VI secretion system secreted protein VgrG
MDIASLLGNWTQSDRIMRLHTVLDADADYGPDALMAETLQAVEGVSPADDAGADIDGAVCGFRLVLSCLSLNAHIELKKLIGQPLLLELDTDTGDTRPFHGIVTHCEIVGANGGMARYRLTIEPWLAFLRYRRDSTVYQDMTVLDIVESVFKDYQGQGKLQPEWKLDVLDASVYPKRSLTTQYQESDLHFVTRLLTEEGLFFYVQHQGDAGSPGLGSHTVVIADHNGSFVPNANATVAFTQSGAVMPSDGVDRWRSVRRWQTDSVEIASWDYRNADTRRATAGSAADNGGNTMPTPLVSRDAPGAYANENRAQAERQANNQMQAIEARNKIFTGAGTVRTFAPGTTFTLTGHTDHDGDDDSNFVILRVVHQARNNLDAALTTTVMQALGEAAGSVGSAVASPAAPTAASAGAGALPTAFAAIDSGLQSASGAAGVAGSAATPVYRNRIDAIRAKIPYRPAMQDSHGFVIHPKPTVAGQQSAIVVGPAGQAIHTDRDHRIKVQFHWQRGADSHSRLAHPSTDGHTGAPANDQSGTWVRVMAGVAPAAGANWGGHAVPRVGQEVLIDFIEGDIDRPVVIGSLYNGAGQAEAQGNQVGQGAGAATGNAPAWFPGEQDGNSHPAVLSGIKTQAMGASQAGSGGYNQLVFDDTPGQSRAGLQQHANPHEGTAELNLGQLRQQSDNQRLAATGFGFELKTQNSSALRAGQGMLVSTDAAAAGAAHLDSLKAQTQLNDSHARVLDLATSAQAQNAKLPGETTPDKIAAIAQMANSAKVIAASGSGSGDTAGGAGQVSAFSEPQLQLSSPSGIAAVTPASAIFAAGNTGAVSAGHDINFAAQGNMHHLASAGISLFTYGKAGSASKPNQETGIALHAATGKFSAQSAAGETKLTAAKLLTVASITKDVQIGAKDYVMLASQGAYLKLQGGNIDIHGPGAMTFKAGMKELTGPASSTANQALASADMKGCAQASNDASAAQAGAQTL